MACILSWLGLRRRGARTTRGGWTQGWAVGAKRSDWMDGVVMHVSFGCECAKGGKSCRDFAGSEQVSGSNCRIEIAWCRLCDARAGAAPLPLGYGDRGAKRHVAGDAARGAGTVIVRASPLCGSSVLLLCDFFAVGPRARARCCGRARALGPFGRRHASHTVGRARRRVVHYFSRVDKCKS